MQTLGERLRQQRVEGSISGYDSSIWALVLMYMVFYCNLAFSVFWPFTQKHSLRSVKIDVLENFSQWADIQKFHLQVFPIFIEKVLGP